ncbi:unnamed protein product [Hymenolepis diminuta]|uniref:Uncharacterized protein n=1 Tax=Hymenolepis diminuta TaxID=6216 RepID=A0A564Y126_HYMDI|nr:unnamed protein product [Hymenolepis diminuta]
MSAGEKNNKYSWRLPRRTSSESLEILLLAPCFFLVTYSFFRGVFPLVFPWKIFHQILDERLSRSSREHSSDFASLLSPIFLQNLFLFLLFARGFRLVRLEQNTAVTINFTGRSPFSVISIASTLDSGYDPLSIGGISSGYCFLFLPLFHLVSVMCSWRFFYGFSFRFICCFEPTIGFVTLVTVSSTF